MRKTAPGVIAFVLAATAATTATTAAAADIPDHRGTDISSIESGTKRLSTNVTQYNSIFKSAGDQYGIDPNILAAVCMQESSGINYSYRDDGTEYPAWGIMQIEYTNENAFKAFGLNYDGTEWTLEDRLDPSKAVPFAAYLLSEALYKYDCDYAKMLQSYNFGQTVLDRIIAAKGDNWLDERKNAVSYVNGWSYDTYGDAQYIEHVLAYYTSGAIEYVGAKVRIGGTLVKFEDQYPIIDNGTTLIPVRAISETIGATVTWDGDAGLVIVNKNGKIIQLNIGDTTAYIDGVPHTIDVSAEVVNGRTMVPLRFVAEALDLSVTWNGDTRTVEID